MGSDTPPRMLGIDVGEKRLGIAVNEGRVAVPLSIVIHTNRAADIERVAQIAREQSAAAIVVGLPLHSSGDESAQARVSRNFGDELARHLGLPVRYTDERLTTADIRTARSGSVRKRGEHVDDLAAAAILQRYIDAGESALESAT
jgi:putative Holliday junction resolvase